MSQAVICGFARSPMQPARRGAFARTRPDELAADVIRALVERTGVKAADIEDLIVGCAMPEAEQGLNVARNIALLAGLPIDVAAVTVNRFCGSSMNAIHEAAGKIAMGMGDVFICAGVESMTRIPMGGFNPMPHPELARTSAAYMGMGETAENLAKQYQIPRADQEAFAIASHQKAAKAAAEGKFADEIVPITTADGTVDSDGTIRPDTSAEGLAGLKPAFDAQGSVTAGTSSPLTDGAAAVLLASEDYARAHSLPILAKIKSVAVAGCAPEIMGIGPVPAATKALNRAGITLADVDIVELNEAFAAQSMAVIRDLGVNPDTLNIDGGALALGHALGASGARITGKAASLLQREVKSYALATMCIGGGQGIATVLEAA